MKKSLSLVATVAYIAIFGFSESNLKVKSEALAEIPPVIIIVPTGNLSCINTKQIIKTELSQFRFQQENII
jgi:hypothetical protein